MTEKPQTSTIDPRLLALIETLSASGADWLAFEILESIRAGRPAEDSEEEIQRARSAVRSFRRREASPLAREVSETWFKPIAGDEQLEFAATYVIDRVSEAVAMARASFDNLDKLAAHAQKTSESAGSYDRLAPNINLRFEDTDLVSDRTQADEASARLAELRTVVLEWLESEQKRSHE
jgi:hypothetical protein